MPCAATTASSAAGFLKPVGGRSPSALLAFVLIAVSGCDLAGSSPAGSMLPPRPSPSAGASTGVYVPTGKLPPDTQCLLDHGFSLTAVLPAEVPGDAPGYKLETDLDPDQIDAISKECRKLVSPPPEKSDAEIKVIYDRWMEERLCLIGLGYHPVEPSTFEKFLADWRTGVSPWMPTDGVDTGTWSGADYETAKQTCTLEFFSRE
jgi:hypothetical protein